MDRELKIKLNRVRKCIDRLVNILGESSRGELERYLISLCIAKYDRMEEYDESSREYEGRQLEF